MATVNSINLASPPRTPLPVFSHGIHAIVAMVGGPLSPPPTYK
ncbi:hypothetical protein MUK42_36212 [Musa troglodytarum]|uniref:Uncharacterized protein n=1 Tax=Musa troglodytarum TaxID=320322 RepID=A0A9E7FKN4_9LILI|nr:hypothetical protein MUK42_36212 [Musa troglodytarum]